LDSKQKTLDELGSILAQMNHDMPSVKLQADGIQTEFNTVSRRFQKLNLSFRSINQNLMEVIAAFEQFQQNDADLNASLAEIFEAVGPIDATNSNELHNLRSKLDDLINGKWKQMKQLVSKLCSIPNVEDGHTVSEKVCFLLYILFSFLSIQRIYLDEIY
jgi:uncharacterized protein YoxC